MKTTTSIIHQLSVATIAFLWAALLLTFQPGAKASTIYDLTADRQVDGDVGGTLEDIDLMGAGSINATYNVAAVTVFQLPTLPVGQKFDAVTYTAYLATRTASPTFNIDLYGLGVDSSSAVLASDFYAGTLDSANTLIMDNFMTPSTPQVSFPTASGTALTNYLISCYANGANAGKYVFFRMNPDSASLGYGRYNIASAEYQSNVFYTARLNYSTLTIGPSGWAAVPLGGGGYVTGLACNSSGTDFYCRSDLGGAFKWNATTGQWDSISDHIISASTSGASDEMNTSSIAVDPSNSNNIYLAVGSSFGGGPKTIYSSANKGSTWTDIGPATPFYIAGDDSVRLYGERLAVDPNHPSLLWFGTAQDGLQKAVKSGSTWTWSQIPNTAVPFGQVPSGTKAGVSFVACDKNGTSTIVYAGVYDTVGTTGGVYQSTDSGATWTKVGGATFSTPHQGRVASNGTLYVTSGTEGTFKMLRGGTFTALSSLPTGYTYNGVAPDPMDASGNTVYVAESNSGAQYNRIWRSVDGGSSWAMQFQNLNNLDYTRMEPDGTPSCNGYWFGYTSALLVSPANSHELWAADFFGVQRTQDAQDLGTTNGCFWYTLQKGQDETVVECLKNAPNGPRLMSGVADVNGFRYLDNYSRPTGTAGSKLSLPTTGSTNWFDFCESNTSVWARTWVNSSHTSGSGTISSDAGQTWMPFGGIASKTVTNAPSDGYETWDLSAYLSQQKALGVNTVTLVVCCANAPNNSSDSLSFTSKNAGGSSTLWPTLVVNGSTPLTATADSYVYGNATTTNYGNATTVQVSGAWSSTSFSRWTYLKFDLSSVGTITSALLQMNRKASALYTTPFQVMVFACTNTTWVEGNGGTDNNPANEITWTNKPAMLASPTDPVNAPNYGVRGGRVAVSATDPNNLVWLPEGNGTAARYSKDRGATWSLCSGAPASLMTDQFTPSSCIAQLTSDRVNGNFYMAKFGDFATNTHIIYKSTDGGATFTQVATISGQHNAQRCQIVAAPGVANDVWLCDDATGLFHSTDAGTTWTHLLPSQVLSAREVTFGKPQAGSGFNYTIFFNGKFYNFTTTVQGIYRSDNYGAAWTILGTTPTIKSGDALAGDRQVYGRVFYGTNGRGIFQFQ